MATRTSRRSKASDDTLQVDFTGVEGRKAARHYEPGDYAVKIVSVEQGESAQKQTPQLVVKYQFMDGPYQGKDVYQRINLLPQSLWVLRNLLEAVGVSVPNKVVQIPLKKLSGKELAITIEDDTYKGDDGKAKTTSKIVDTFPIDDLAEAGEDDELPEDEDEEEEETEEAEDEDTEDEDEDDLDLDDL